MGSQLIFVYDGDCPFCNHFAELLELKSGLDPILLRNARDNPPELPLDYDMDTNGAVLIKDGEMLFGAEAINWICLRINKPSDTLLKILTFTFSSSKRSNFLFPLLIFSRRIALFFKGSPRKIVF